MKFAFSFLLLIYTTFCFSQNYFKINAHAYGGLLVKVNSDTIKLSDSFTKVETNYPQFDTVIFISDWANSHVPIVCNFKPDTIYTVSLACCTSLDIIPISRFDCDSLKYWDSEKDHEKIQNQLMDKPSISLKLEGETSDTIYGWNVDLACFPKFKRLSNKKWKYGVPDKCYYWNNISQFIFFKSKTDYSKMTNKQEVIEDIYPEYESIEILGEINIRLFDNQSYVLSYDLNSGQISLEYD